MWCSPATILILAIIVVSGAHRHQGSCSSTCPTSTPERVAARKLDHHASHVVVVVVLVAVVVVAVVVSVIAAAAVIAAAVLLAHARAIIRLPTSCPRILDDSIRRVCRVQLLPASN